MHACLPLAAELVRGTGSGGGEELEDKREDTHEVYMQNVIQRMHAYHWQQSWCGGLGLGGEKLEDKREDTHEVYMQNVIEWYRM